MSVGCRAWLTFTFGLEYTSFRTEVLRKVFRALNIILSHELLLFRGKRFLLDWRWIRGDWVHSMEPLTEEVSLVSEEDLCSFDLSKPEDLNGDFRHRYGHRI